MPTARRRSSTQRDSVEGLVGHQPFPRPLPDPPRIDLATILGPNPLDPITNGQAITFHAVGDTGASSTALIDPEARVADAMADEVSAAGTHGAAFLFHLGDVACRRGASSAESPLQQVGRLGGSLLPNARR